MQLPLLRKNTYWKFKRSSYARVAEKLLQKASFPEIYAHTNTQNFRHGVYYIWHIQHGTSSSSFYNKRKKSLFLLLLLSDIQALFSGPLSGVSHSRQGPRKEEEESQRLFSSQPEVVKLRKRRYSQFSIHCRCIFVCIVLLL